MLALLNVGAAHPQLHSHDYRVRLRAAALFTIVFEHVSTLQDFSVLDDALPAHRAAHSAGITEWQGMSAGGVVSLGWDWLRLHDGALVPDRTVPVRSNFMLLDAQGYDTSAQECDDMLWQLIQEMPWRAAAAQALAAELAL
jgi:hypothetical protein